MPSFKFPEFIMILSLFEIFNLILCLDLHLNAWFKVQMCLGCTCWCSSLVLGQGSCKVEFECRSTLFIYLFIYLFTYLCFFLNLNS
jgi:hypothetical protein